MSYHRGTGLGATMVLNTAALQPPAKGFGFSGILVVGAIGAAGYLAYRKFFKKA